VASYYEFINPRWIWRTLIVVGGISALALLLDTWHQLNRLHVEVGVAESERGIIQTDVRDIKGLVFELRDAVRDFSVSRQRAIDALREHDKGR
jgi:hypothetical protein